MIELSVRLLSGIRVARDGEERAITSRRQRAVMAALALRPGRSVSSEQLIEALWGEEPPQGARATLQTYISRLRRSLGDDAVLNGPGGYRLADGATCDVDLARRLAADARAALATTPERAADAAQQALDLWDGPALAELADTAWFVPALTGLEELRANLVDVAAEALVAAGRSEQAVELIEPAARADPLREPSHVLLVDALRASGRNVDALRVAERYRRHLRDETGLDPGPALVAAEQRALTADGGETAGETGGRPMVVAPGHTLGAVLPRASRMIGREGDLDRVVAALATARLVTICGPGGVGKTRLAAEVAATLGASAAVIVVELAAAGSDDVVAAVAAALQLRSDRASLPTIAEQLRDIDGALIVDNAEHVVDEVRELARTVLDHCPRMRIVVTSRVRLDVAGEQMIVLAPLTTGGDRPAAVELFIDRLERSGRATGVDADDPRVRRICDRLDGLPLALELAAGRAAVLGVDGLRDRLDAALDLVASGAGGGGERHGSLRALVGWSYELLDEPSRRLIDALAVFAGEFDLDAAERVGAAVLGQPVSLLVGRLVDASLVATTGVAGRYRLLEMIRQFGREHLTSGDRMAHARDAHARWVSERLAGIAAAAVGSDEQLTSARLDGLRDEVRSALRWARERGDAELAAALVVPLAGPLLYRPDAELIAMGCSAVRHLVEVGPQHDGLPTGLTAAGARLAFLAGELDDVDRLADLALGDRRPDAPGARARAA
ncbi:MAG: BTAD domain-containing putative transcriptional regulator, partial [Candidatus Limnocylindrales bacterium]